MRSGLNFINTSTPAESQPGNGRARVVRNCEFAANETDLESAGARAFDKLFQA